MIPPDEIEAIIRDDASEDWYGLYEIIWALNTRYPEVSEYEKVTTAIAVIKKLIQAGEVILFRSNWPNQTHFPVENAEAIELVVRAQSWEPPSEESDDTYISFGAA